MLQVEWDTWRAWGVECDLNGAKVIQGKPEPFRTKPLTQSPPKKVGTCKKPHSHTISKTSKHAAKKRRQEGGRGKKWLRGRSLEGSRSDFVARSKEVGRWWVKFLYYSD